MNLAAVSNRRDDFTSAKAQIEEAEPLLKSALAANPKHTVFRGFQYQMFAALAVSYAGLLNQPGAVRAGDAIRDLGLDPASDAYNAACALSLCIPILAKHDRLTAEERQRATEFYADRALALLHEAIGKGFRNASHIKSDPDLEPIRRRAEFGRLITQLEGSKAQSAK